MAHTVIHEQCVLIPMRDGTLLAAEIWRPAESADLAPLPGIVMRTPYGRVGDMNPHVEAGFCCIVVDARGTGASQGTYDYYNLEAGRFDGYDLVEWLAEQPWCNGRIAALGGSALGIYAIATAAENPPHLECVVVNVIPSDFYAHQWYPGGVQRLESRKGWCLGTMNRCSPGSVWDAEAANDMIQRPYKAALAAQRYADLTTDPLAWSRPYFELRERTKLWQDIDLTPLIAAMKVPTLFGGIYYDHFGKGTIAAHAVHPGPKHLTMQSGSVSKPLEAGSGEIPWAETVAWLRYYVCDEGDCPAGGEHWYLCGAEKRVHLPSAPIPRLYQLPIADAAFIQHDPQRPLISVLGQDPLNFDEFAAQGQVTIIDVPTQSLPLGSCVLGHPVLRFKARSNNVQAQLLVRFCIYNESAPTRMLNIGARRLFIEDDYSAARSFTTSSFESHVEFWTIAYQLQPNDSIRLLMSASDSPFWESPTIPFEIELTELSLELPVIEGLAATLSA